MSPLVRRAVLTGDIIRSSRLRQPELQSVRLSLVNASSTVRKWKTGILSGKPEFFRGDGWQLVVVDPAMAMRVAIFLRASLLASGLADTRIAIGLGEVEDDASGRVSLSTGTAFTLSGRALDGMTSYASMTINAPSSLGSLADWLPLVGHLCDSLIEQWTRRQSQIICAVIAPNEPDYNVIARKLTPAISKQAVAKALRGANWRVIREVIHQFEKTPWKEMPLGVIAN